MAKGTFSLVAGHKIPLRFIRLLHCSVLYNVIVVRVEHTFLGPTVK